MRAGGSDFLFLGDALIAGFGLLDFGFIFMMFSGNKLSSSTMAGQGGYPLTLANTTVVGEYSSCCGIAAAAVFSGLTSVAFSTFSVSVDISCFVNNNLLIICICIKTLC